MRIVFLLLRADEPGEVTRAVLARAGHLAARHDVEVVSVFRTRDRPHAAPDPRVPLRHLVDRAGPGSAPDPVPLRPTALTDRARRRLATLPSALVDPAADADFDALADTELTLAPRTLDADVLVTASPALLPAVADHLPAEVVRIHEAHGAGDGPAVPVRAGECDAVVVRSECARRRAAEELGGAGAPRVEVIPYPAPDGFRPRSSRTSRTAVVAGPLTPRRQVDHAIAAFASAVSAASADGPPWRLRVYGDGPELPRLRRQVAELGLYERVELLGASPHMAAEWAKASVAVLPSRAGEAFPQVLLEAYAAGVPAVAYDVPGGAAEVVRHGVDGLLAPPDDVGALREALGRLTAADGELLHRLGGNARAGVGRFAAEGVTVRWEELCAELTATPAAARVARRAGPEGAAHGW